MTACTFVIAVPSGDAVRFDVYAPGDHDVGGCGLYVLGGEPCFDDRAARLGAEWWPRLNPDASRRAECEAAVLARWPEVEDLRWDERRPAALLGRLPGMDALTARERELREQLRLIRLEADALLNRGLAPLN